MVDAARKEGKVTIYGQFDQAVYEQYITAFNSKYPGIEVEVVFSTGPQAAEKIRTEVAAGKVQGDVAQLHRSGLSWPRTEFWRNGALQA